MGPVRAHPPGPSSELCCAGLIAGSGRYLASIHARSGLMDAGMAGGLAGGIVGVMGGAIGTYFSIRNTTRPRERALMLRLAASCWLWLAGLVAWMFLMPRP